MSKIKTVSNFDRFGYWKGRMNAQIQGLYLETVHVFRDVKESAIRIGADPHKMDKAVTHIGEAFNELQAIVDGLGPQKPTMTPPEGKIVEDSKKEEVKDDKQI